MVRTRFAPSPTGYLHIGGARTALYSWLYARKNKGVFILRIEDTDVERSTTESVDAILEGMKWLNLNYDEGPIHQSSRFSRYQEVILTMLAAETAYRCYCSKERLEILRAAQLEKKEKPRYDGLCRHSNQKKSDADPFVVRFKNPEDGVVEFEDLVRGKVIFANQELDDLIIARSDGTPTYNFTVVVDDWDMHITHVIRGDDHINNTPRQINILRALGAHIPQYAHLPMILGPDGKRLSKRHGAMSVLSYREEGFLPQALLNYLARLGWSHGDQEIFSIDELINYFSIEAINRASAAINTEKLLWLNQYYLKTDDVNEVAKELQWQMDRLTINTQTGPSLTDVVMIQRERTKTLKEMAERSRYFFEDVVLDEKIAKQISDDIIPLLKKMRDQFLECNWIKEDIHQMIQQTAEQAQIKLGTLAQSLRIALTGGTVSPPIDATIYLIGKARVIKRLDQAIEKRIDHPT